MRRRFPAISSLLVCPVSHFCYKYHCFPLFSSLAHLSLVQSQSAIFAMGLVGAGTNNSRVAGLLRTLATFYRSEPTLLFVVRLAQGLLHMGKGLISLNPFHSDRLLLSPVALSGIISSMLLFLDVKATVHGKFHFLLYSFAIAMNPRWCVTLDEVGGHGHAESSSHTALLLFCVRGLFSVSFCIVYYRCCRSCTLACSNTSAASAFVRSLSCVCLRVQTGAEVKVEVRVGGAVQTVGQAGKPKTITGFQTHTTPVLMQVKDRAELVDDAFIPLTTVVEGIVVLRANPLARAKAGAGGGKADKSSS